MFVRKGQVADFSAVGDLVSDAVAIAFDHPELSAAQRAENQHIIDIASRCCQAALDDDERAIFSALETDHELVGFIIVDNRDASLPEIDWLIVSPRHHGTGVAQKLMNAALAWVGNDKTIRLGVIHFNARAIAFYRKFGFVETGEIVGRHQIPRKVMIRKPPLDQSG
jgi:ribosomal protein S18 acetylase RimI-like enzyme